MAEAISSLRTIELNRTPRPLAEDLDQHLASLALRKYERRSNPSGLLRSAWNNAESALNAHDTQKKVTDEYFHTSQLLINMIINHPDTTQDMLLSGLTLSTYISVFSKRANGEVVTSDDCKDIYTSLGHAMRFLRPLRIEEPPQWRMIETAVLALSARTQQPGLLMYPTSPREENSSISSLNHDSYFLDQDGKIPIQQKLQPTQKTYDEWIQLLTVQPLIDKALKHTGENKEVPLSEKINYLLSLVVIESTGRKLYKDELKFLNFMTESIAAHYFKARSVDKIVA